METAAPTVLMVWLRAWLTTVDTNTIVVRFAVKIAKIYTDLQDS